MTNQIQLYLGDCKDVLKKIEDNSIDLIVTDPPYQLASITKRFGKEGSAPCQFGKDGAFQRVSKGFMGKEWDILPPIEVWKECLRVLKPGAFAFIMTTPRQDSLCQILMDLSQAGFVMGFTSIYWAYASGFPKAINISLHIDKQECKKELKEKLGRNPTKEEFEEKWKNYREIISKKQHSTNFENAKLNKTGYLQDEANQNNKKCFGYGEEILGKSHSPKAKEFEGSYGGFQPKPAVEIIIVCMKPLSEKSYIDQALKNGKGITNLDDCRIPYDKEYKPQKRGNLNSTSKERNYGYKDNVEIGSEKGRFPANLLVSDDVLNDGIVSKSSDAIRHNNQSEFSGKGIYGKYNSKDTKGYNDSGSFSRYFDLDAWAKENNISEDNNTFPFLICPKASKSEKNKGLDNLPKKQKIFNGQSNNSSKDIKDVEERFTTEASANFHPTVKPIKLMSYLITLGSKKEDIILDPFAGSCTTGVACKLLGRKFIGIELNKEYLDIGSARIKGYNNEKK